VRTPLEAGFAFVTADFGRCYDLTVMERQLERLAGFSDPDVARVVEGALRREDVQQGETLELGLRELQEAWAYRRHGPLT